jgi:hypothetical protein
MPYDLYAVGDSSGRKINVRWKLKQRTCGEADQPATQHQQRDDFETVAELSGDRSGYVDEDVRPATSYFYRFV